MKIERFEDIEGWQMARELTRMAYSMTRKARFAKDFELCRQLQSATGSSMHNVAEGFDSETTAEFIRFLRYAKRSCTEAQSEIYVALDQGYVTKDEFDSFYEQARRTRAVIWAFIKYLRGYPKKKLSNQRPQVSDPQP